MKKINDLQDDSIKVILESLKDYTTDNVVFFRTLFHTGTTDNIILRPYKPESLTTYTYLIDVMGNRERLSEDQYEKLLETYQ